MRLYNLCRSGKFKPTAIFVTLQAKEKPNWKYTCVRCMAKIEKLNAGGNGKCLEIISGGK